MTRPRPRPDVPPRTTPEEKLERILASAGELFAHDGFHATPVEAISAHAGVSKGLIYVHFPSKTALLGAVLEGAITRWFEEGVRGALSASGSAREMLAATFRASMRHAAADPILRGILAQDPKLLFDDGGPIDPRLVHGYVHAMSRLLAFGVETGEFRKDLDVETGARSLWLIHRVLVQELFVDPSLLDVPAEHTVEGAIDLMLSGFLARDRSD